MKILVTGCAGFIGYHLCKKLTHNSKYKIFGIDNLDNYYDINLKKTRLNNLKKQKNFIFNKINIVKKKQLENYFKKKKINVVINLAAQAGVRNSIKNPDKYFDSNIIGFYNILNISKHNKVDHFIFASTSSVYGNTAKFPTDENTKTDSPESFYAATKKCNEVLSYSYSNIYKLPTTCLRFFTVYGPLGRPDMALFKFVNLVNKNKPIELFNNGKHIRDFTYIDDVVNYIEKIIKIIPKGKTPYNVLNIGSNKPKTLAYFISIIQKNLNKKIKINKIAFQKGDVYKTHADNSKIKKLLKKEFYTNFEKGIREFIGWHRKYHDDK